MPCPSAPIATSSQLHGHQFAAPRQGVVGDGQQGAVTRVADGVAGGVEHPVHQPPRHGLGLSLFAPLAAVHPAEGELHQVVRGRIREPGCSVQLRDAGDVAADRRRPPGQGHLVHEAGHVRRRGRQARHTGGEAPGGEDGRVRPDGSHGVRDESAAGSLRVLPVAVGR